MSNDKKCPTCGGDARYVAEIGAPGFGQSWECVNGHALWYAYGTLTNYKDLSEKDVTLSPEDVI